jgi:hypothetical protein
MCGLYLPPDRTPVLPPHAPVGSYAPEPASYETFLVSTWQLPSVSFILPHESADTSNTDSNLKEGALYGFFAVGSATSRALPSLALLLFNCCAP